jgi:glycine cleavage system aminomethyltransferase T
MTLASEVKAIRSSVGLSRGAHIAVVRVDGQDSLEFLQHVSTQSPYMREGRVRHALFLREDASVFADVFIVKAEESFLILAEGPSEAEAVAWLESLREHTKKNVTIAPTPSEWVVFGIDGPYAWEVAAGLLGPAVLGMPYLTLMRHEELLCVRAGKTGEYGYLLLAPRQSESATLAKLLEVGRPLDVVTVGREALDVCALENWHFSMRLLRDTRPRDTSPLTPIELQLQWRLVYTRDFLGAEALRKRRAEGLTVRATCFTADAPVAAGQRIRLGDLEVGEVLAACDSPTVGCTVGSALLEARFAHPHLTLTSEAATLRTCTASLVDNMSLHVDPHKHAYASRAESVTP